MKHIQTPGRENPADPHTHTHTWERVREEERKDKNMEIGLRHLLKICNYIYIKLYIYLHINFIYIYIKNQRITAEQHYLYYWDKAVQSWVLLITWLVSVPSEGHLVCFILFILILWALISLNNSETLPAIVTESLLPQSDGFSTHLRKSRPLHSQEKHLRGSNFPSHFNKPSSEVIWSPNLITEGLNILYTRKKKRLSPF